jgi:peroxiredoxin
MKKRMPLILVALLAVGLGIGLSLWRLSPKPVELPAQWVFDLSFPDSKGQQVALSSVRGDLTVVNFWATWCPPCIEEMPELSSIHREMSPKGVKVVGLAVDSPSAVRGFLETREFSYPLLITGASGSELGKRLGNSIEALPYTVLIDEKGNVIKQKLGRIREEELRSWVSELR